MGEQIDFPLNALWPQLGCSTCSGVAKRVITDTRQLQPGDLFVALRGARFDGHAFLAQAAEQGAVGAVVEQKNPNLALPQCVVGDTLEAYGQIAAWHRRRMPLKALVGITGSNGKTSTKGMLAEVLALQGETLATAGNLNNEIGVPHTLLAITPAHRYAVIEMGANHKGEIARIAGWGAPTLGIITQAAEAHVGEFGSLEAIIEAKGEMIDALSSDAPIVLNSGSPGFSQWCRRAKTRGVRVVSFGQQADDQVRLLGAEQCPEGVKVSLVDLYGQKRAFMLPLWGVHQGWNAAAVVAAAQLLEVPWVVIEQGLQQFRGAPGRMQPVPLAGGSLLLDDSYNANPASVRAAVKTLADGTQPVIVCLGPLAELGAEEKQLLMQLGTWLRQQKGVVLWGLDLPLYPAVEAFGSSAQLFMSPEAMAKALVHQLRKTPAKVLIKGSRSAGMEKIINLMRQMDADLFI